MFGFMVPAQVMRTVEMVMRTVEVTKTVEMVMRTVEMVMRTVEVMETRHTEQQVLREEAPSEQRGSTVGRAETARRTGGVGHESAINPDTSPTYKIILSFEELSQVMRTVEMVMRTVEMVMRTVEMVMRTVEVMRKQVFLQDCST
ncbi:kinase D-interacting substrate of 220 kDa-like [Arapaima gigas]